MSLTLPNIGIDPGNGTYINEHPFRQAERLHLPRSLIGELTPPTLSRNTDEGSWSVTSSQGDPFSVGDDNCSMITDRNIRPLATRYLLTPPGVKTQRRASPVASFRKCAVTVPSSTVRTARSTMIVHRSATSSVHRWAIPSSAPVCRTRRAVTISSIRVRSATRVRTTRMSRTPPVGRTARRQAAATASSTRDSERTAKATWTAAVLTCASSARAARPRWGC